MRFGLMATVVLSMSSIAAAQQASGNVTPPMTREGSGTSWQPDESPMYAVHLQRGAWTLMSHENAFVQALDDAGDRGASQAGSVNWFMEMAERSVATGHLELRGMISLEPWTVRGCGYPDLLTSGEICNGQKIHDRQHPHDLWMEIAVKYDAPLTSATRWQVYGGPAGEPAIGPGAFPHRVSAMPDPIAPISHHWLDSTHVSFGVVTGGVYGSRWKAEGSIFNGREPDQHRTDFDFGALDSYSARVWFLPTPRVALQVSAGHLKDAEVAAVGGIAAPLAPRVTVNRVTASLSYTRMSATRVWASTFAWGRNSEPGIATNAILAETNVTLEDRDTWFGRFEATGKTADDLDLVGVAGDAFTVGKLQGGYTRYLSAVRGFRPGIGFVVSLGLVPEALKNVYGGRTIVGAGVYVTLRPAMMKAGGTSTASSGMVMVQTALDPAKLSCAAGFDPATAPTATYQGKTYYFCSTMDRDRFLTDPEMSLSMRPPNR
jgi:YHS domain-containing protein